jgi:hypothetical protein
MRARCPSSPNDVWNDVLVFNSLLLLVGVASTDDLSYENNSVGAFVNDFVDQNAQSLCSCSRIISFDGNT